MRKKIFHTALRSIKMLGDPFYRGNVAEMAFYFIFSIIPILTLLLHGVSFFPLTEKLYDSMLLSFEKNQQITEILKSLQNSNSGSFNLIFLVMALWSASKIIFSMIRLANYTYRLEDRRENGYFRSRFRAVFTAGAMILMMMATLLILVYGKYLLLLLNTLLEQFLHRTISAKWLLSAIKWPVALVLYWLFLAIMYKLLPGKRIPIRHTIPGSLFAAAGILVCTGVYSFYLKHFSNFNVIYGSLGAVIALLLWFYIVSYALMLGMIINAAWFEGDRN